ncbi:MAG TPA: Shedu immune nuclease family protein [Aldersonia sp.]
MTGRAGQDAKLELLLALDEEASARLIELSLALKGIDPSGDETLKFDENLLAAVMADPQTASTAYRRDPERFKLLIRSDITAKDVAAVAARCEVVRRFEQLLDDPIEFEKTRAGGKHEAVWQRFFEANPWLLGVGLSGHLFTAWDPKKLEKSVGGSTVAEVGKRVDALLTTSGLVRSLVLAEIKRHDDPLLDREYRSGCWPASSEVTAGVAQTHTTVERARDDLGAWLAARDDEGYRTGEEIYAGAPRSFLVIGTLASLTRNDNVNPDMVRSFELYRRNMRNPEILTYDEVLARARWGMELLERAEPGDN